MAEIFATLAKLGINKKILHGGKGQEPNYEDGTKIYFHYKTTKCDEEKTVIDDSHKHEKPMELILGKKFKLEIWEVCLKTMRPDEVAEFTVDAKHLSQYPLVSKSLRGIFLKDKPTNHETEQHCCGMMGYAQQGLGYEDLDDLMKNPQPLIFILEVLKVERTGEFEKENWTLSDDEKLLKMPKLREEGNALFKQKKYTEAADKYGEAIGMLEQLVIKEKPGEIEWEELESKKIPFLLNFSQCKLCLGDYYPVIEHTTTVLKREPEVLKVERTGEFEKENWTLSDDEKLLKMPKLREEGNALFKQKKYSEAADKYGEAIGMLEQLVIKEKPGEIEWEELESKKIPFLLNFSQCKLCLGDYYPVIEHTTTVLKREPENTKALYRQAKAHVGAWNPEDAKLDFKRVIELDPSLTNAVNKELKQLDELILEKEKNLMTRKN